MPVHITYHSIRNEDLPRNGISETVELLGPKVGDRVTLAVGTEAHTTATDAGMLARIVTTENCSIEIGLAALADATKGEYWLAGTSETRFIAKGHRISVIAGA